MQVDHALDASFSDDFSDASDFYDDEEDLDIDDNNDHPLDAPMASTNKKSTTYHKPTRYSTAAGAKVVDEQKTICGESKLISLDDSIFTIERIEKKGTYSRFYMDLMDKIQLNGQSLCK